MGRPAPPPKRVASGVLYRGSVGVLGGALSGFEVGFATFRGLKNELCDFLGSKKMNFATFGAFCMNSATL